MSKSASTRNTGSTYKSVSFKMTHDWQFKKSLAQCNEEMLGSGLLSDVTFLVGGKKQLVHAHRYMLASRSSVFFSMLTEGGYDDDEVIVIDDVDADTFRQILRYMYTDDVVITPTNVTAIYCAAKKFCLGGLVDLCIQILSEGVVVETVCKILEQAHQYGEKALQKHCLDFIFKNAHAVLKSSAFQSLCPECAESVIEADELRASEYVVYEAMYNWSTKACKRNKLPINGDSRQRVMGNLRYLIRFPVMDLQYFTKVVSNQDLLAQDEKISLFQYFHSRTAPKVMQFVSKRRLVTRAIRFEVTSGAWNVGKIPDSVRFQSSRDVILDGVIIYGCFEGMAEYEVVVKILDKNNTVLSETRQNLDTNSQEEFYDIMLDNKVKIEGQTWYTLFVFMNGPQTKRGINGKTMVYCEQVQFFFKTSTLSMNCTTENEGQVAGILFHD